MNRFCEVCGMADMVLGDSSLYCRNCGAQSNQYIEEAFDAEDTHIFNTTFVRERGTRRNAEQQQSQPQIPPRKELDETLDGLDGLEGLFGSLQDRQDPVELTPEVFNGSAPFSVKTENLSQPGTSQFGPEFDPTSRMSKDELASTIRKSYMNGLQKILQLQLECLVKEFGATPLICGIAGPIWLRFVASTRVFEKAWADEAVLVAEHQEKMRRESQQRVPQAEAPSHGDATVDKQKRKRAAKPKKDRPGPHTSYGRHLSLVWLSALKQRIPLSMTLAVSYLSCYIAREPILPTDIRSWALNGQLPYLAAFVEISKSAPYHIPNTVGEKQIFPMKPKLMFRPLCMPGARYLELLAGFVAERAGVQLPPVNFHLICARFLRDMRLPIEKLLPYACRLYEWYAPAGLFLSARRAVLPTRVYVMAMLVITLKVLYNLDGRPPQQEETDTQKSKAELPASNENDNNRRFEVPHARVTRSRAKEQASAEACMEKEQQTISENTIRDTQASVATVRDDHFSVPEGRISGKRKISVTTRGQSQVSGEDVRISDETSGLRSLKTREKIPERQKALADTKDLLERLESVKSTNTVDFDEELTRYLKYCKNVLFTGNECDAGMEPILEYFWGIYEKNVNKVKKQSVNLDGEATASEGIEKKPIPQAGTSGGLDRAGSPERDAPSAGSSRPDWSSRRGASKQNKEEKGKESLHTHNSGAPSASQFNKRHTERPETSSPVAAMKKAGFSCLPPLAFDVGLDEYVRYNFQDSGKVLLPIHKDYFRVLQACGKLISVHPKALNRCVQRIEKGLLQVESNVEQFLLGEKGVDVVKLAKAVKRRKSRRRRDKIAQAENAKCRAEMTQHLKDLSYL